MQWLLLLLTVSGLILFEVVSSLDNAIINAEVLTQTSRKARRWFLTWGLFLAVFLMRGLLPFLIVWFSVPSLSIYEVFTATISSSEHVQNALASSAPKLLTGGGTFLILLFLNWLFLEPKSFQLRGEKFFEKQGVWFYAISSLFLSTIIWAALQKDSFMAFAASLGSSAFFITHGFKHHAESAEASLLTQRRSDISKILYLEVIDATFSIDGVLGAFAFTLSVPLIIIGNGIGAYLVRSLTIGNIERIKKWRGLKNGAMYSILVLGSVMVADGFGAHIPEWLCPIATFLIIGYFYWKMKIHARKQPPVV